MEMQKYVCNSVVKHRPVGGSLIVALFVKKYDEHLGIHGNELFAGPVDLTQMYNDAEGNTWIPLQGGEPCRLNAWDVEAIQKEQNNQPVL